MPGFKFEVQIFTFQDIQAYGNHEIGSKMGSRAWKWAHIETEQSDKPQDHLQTPTDSNRTSQGPKVLKSLWLSMPAGMRWSMHCLVLCQQLAL